MITQKNFERDPFTQFLKWYDDAVAAQIKNPEAMTLATAAPDGTPSARIVLFKGIRERETQGLKFFTNYNSRKAEEIQNNPKASLVFYWPALDRQIRIEGRLEKLSPTESDQYWASRPRGSQVGAIASPQSEIVPGREILEKRFDEITLEYEGKAIPRPAHWGGYCLIPHRFEFWFAGDFRLHDRICYILEGRDWKQVRLAP